MHYKDFANNLLHRNPQRARVRRAGRSTYKLKYITDYNLDEVKNILNEQLDNIPSYWWTRYRKTTPVCGKIDRNRFELRNNIFHMYSLRAYGELWSDGDKTIIEIEFKQPPLLFNIYGNILRRYNADKRIILKFLEEWLEIKEIYKIGRTSHSSGRG